MHNTFISKPSYKGKIIHCPDNPIPANKWIMVSVSDTGKIISIIHILEDFFQKMNE